MPHIDITMMPGRDDSVKKEIAVKVQQFIAKELNIDEKFVSVSIEDIEKEELAASENYHERFSLREKINRIKGFTMAHFMDINTNGRASA